MTTIAVEFLHGTFYGMRSDQPGIPEWPPAPARLFSAMTAAIRRLDPPDQEAVRGWLQDFECWSPPTISAVAPAKVSPCCESYAVRPVIAIAQREKPRRCKINPRTDKLSRAFMHLVDPVVLFHYSNPIPDDRRDVVQRLLASITYLGSSESTVHVSLADEAKRDKHVQYVPHGHPQFNDRARKDHVRVGVHTHGRLRHLDEAFAQRQRLERKPFEPRGIRNAPSVLYSVALDATSPAAKTADMGLMIVLAFTGRFDGDVPDDSDGNIRNRPDLDTLRFGIATQAVRRAFLSRVDENASEVLTGHPIGQPDAPARESRVAFIPLAEVGYPYATSRLRGVAMVLPRDITLADRKAAEKAFALDYVVIRRTRWRVEPMIDSDLVSLKTQRYCRASTQWVTAVPIVLQRHIKKRETPVEIIAKAVALAGLPRPIEIQLSPYPFIEGTYPVQTYQKVVPFKRYIVHARITFDVPVEGPVLLGRHRHAGYGLCLSVDPIRKAQLNGTAAV